MKHTLFANNRRTSHNDKFNPGGYYQHNPPNSKTKPDSADTKSDMILESLLRRVTEKYNGNQDVRSEIQSRTEMYSINVSLAREYHDKNAVKQLRKEFIQYLNSKL